MQNIADYMIYSSNLPLENHNKLPQYITYNSRIKTISVTKQQYQSDDKLDSTPEGSLLDHLTNCRELLITHCKYILPPQESIEEYLKSGPSFYFDYHPSLGPLYTVIAQKIHGGALAKGSELIIEATEVKIMQLTLDGSLLVHADTPCGHFNEHGLLEYSHKGGKCTLIDVTVVNQGIDRESTQDYWKGNPVRKERCLIEIEGDGEFYAKNITIEGNRHYHVPAGHRLEVTPEGESLHKIDAPTWWWKYRFAADDSIVLE